MSEKDGVQPFSSKRLPTSVLEPQRGKFFSVPNLWFQPFLFPQGNLLPPGIAIKYFLFSKNYCVEILPQALCYTRTTTSTTTATGIDPQKKSLVSIASQHRHEGQWAYSEATDSCSVSTTAACFTSLEPISERYARRFVILILITTADTSLEKHRFSIFTVKGLHLGLIYFSFDLSNEIQIIGSALQNSSGFINTNRNWQ